MTRITRIIPGSACVSHVDLGVLAEINLLAAITTELAWKTVKFAAAGTLTLAGVTPALP